MPYSIAPRSKDPCRIGTKCERARLAVNSWVEA